MEDINRVRILNTAYNLFNTRGYRSVTVQDLAEELGMSKKTIYQYFDGKEEIATAVVESTINKITLFKDNCKETQSDPLLAIKELLLYVQNESLRFGPLFIMDIQKYLPGLAERYNNFRKEGKATIKQYLESAQNMGLIKDIPIKLAMEILHESIRAVIKPEFLSHNNFAMNEVLNTFIDIFISGISLPKAANQ